MLRALLPSLLLTTAAHAQPEAVEMLVFASPGLFKVSAKGKISGPGAHLVKRIGEVSGVKLHVKVMPVARLMQTLTQQPGHCTVGVPRLPEREPLLAWAGVVASSSMMLYGRLDETRAVAGVADLRDTVIAAQRESRPAAWVREQGLKLQEVRDSETGLRMLQARRVDYWLVNELLARTTFSGLGSEPARALQNFGRIDAELACHRHTAPAILDKLRQTVQTLRHDGELVPFGVR
jgi:polar amino acid transport system substrate-binding protein